MHSLEEYETVAGLIRLGLNDCQISRQTGINRRTSNDWHRRGRPGRGRMRLSDCPRCSAQHWMMPLTLISSAYASGMGGSAHLPLPIVQDSRYTGLM